MDIKAKATYEVKSVKESIEDVDLELFNIEHNFSKSVLLIDLDDVNDLKQFKFLLNKQIELNNLSKDDIESLSYWSSKSGEGYHVKICLNKKMTDEQLLLYQLLLGSDVVRESYSLHRILHEKTHDGIFSMLYRPLENSIFIFSSVEEFLKS